jgi:hypothetical protein
MPSPHADPNDGAGLAAILVRVWPLLREALRLRQTVTYSELAAWAGPPATRRNVHRLVLTPLAQRCRSAGLPDLSALVVRKESGRPGGGWWAGHAPGADVNAVWAEALERCYAHAWTAALDPRLVAPGSA